MLSKIDKKVVVIAVVFLVLLLVGGVFAYKYLTDIRTEVENTNGSENIENQNSEGEANIEIEGGTQNGLIICSDKCGDGICQPPEEKCDNLNCICKEDKQECPQDCK